MVRTCMVVQDSSGCACHCLSLMHRIMLGHLEPYTIHISPERLKECGFPAVFPQNKTGKQVPCCRQQGCFARAVVVSSGHRSLHGSATKAYNVGAEDEVITPWNRRTSTISAIFCICVCVYIYTHSSLSLSVSLYRKNEYVHRCR